jgi:hypothetical protein
MNRNTVKGLVVGLLGGAFIGTATVATAITSGGTPGTYLPVIPPTFRQATCQHPAVIHLPSETGVEYSIDTIPSGAGNYRAALGVHAVQVNAADGAPSPQIGGITTWHFTAHTQGWACAQH